MVRWVWLIVFCAPLSLASRQTLSSQLTAQDSGWLHVPFFLLNGHLRNHFKCIWALCARLLRLSAHWCHGLGPTCWVFSFLLMIPPSFCDLLLMAGSLSQIGLIAACIFKYTRIRSYSSLEISLLFLLAYLPYVVAEALLLSGIMAILVCGIVMSHYTYFNLSAFSQVCVSLLYGETLSWTCCG